MSTSFKWRHYRGKVILWAVRWYCRYGISYRELEEMLEERRVDVDHTTIYRWVQHYAPEMEKRLRFHWRRPSWSGSWQVDETYIKVKGKWMYLYRAVINTDNAPTYGPTIAALKAEGKCLPDTEHRQTHPASWEKSVWLSELLGWGLTCYRKYLTTTAQILRNGRLETG